MDRFRAQLQADAPGQAARKNARNEGRNLVLESEAELLLLAKEGVESGSYGTWESLIGPIGLMLPNIRDRSQVKG